MAVVLRERRELRPLLLRVLVNLAVWLIGLLLLAVVAGFLSLLFLLDILVFTIFAGLAIAGLVLFACGLTLTFVLYLPVEIEFTSPVLDRPPPPP
jgi:hypothetical protein